MRTLLRRRRSPELSCRELVELVTDYFEDALTVRDRRRFDAHVEGCDGCSAHLAQMRAVHDQLGRLTPPDLPPEAEQMLRDAFSAWRA